MKSGDDVSTSIKVVSSIICVVLVGSDGINEVTVAIVGEEVSITVVTGKDVATDEADLTVILSVVSSSSVMALDIVNTGIILVFALSVVVAAAVFVALTFTGLYMATMGGTVIINEKDVVAVLLVEGLGSNMLL